MTLSIPALDPDADIATAALAYAEAGWYVLPVDRGTKHPGSILGKGWPAKTSRDPKQIVAWFAGTNDGLALHCGRSGAVVFDVDAPENIPTELAEEVESARPPAQASRRDNLQRAHYLFLQPPGRNIGNGGGKLGGAWGEVRGKNGIIVVAPTPHSKPEGEYRWLRAGRLPVLGDGVAGLLPDQASTEDAATDAEIDAFLNKHTTVLRPELVEGVVNSLRTDLENSKSRHQSAVIAACWALREAQAGMFDARAALTALWPIFRDSLRDEPGRSPSLEWRGIVAWAVAQAKTDDPEATRAKLIEDEPFAEEQQPRAHLRDLLLRRSQLQTIQAPRYLILDTLDMESETWLIGAPGGFKSFVALDWACRVATGSDWAGQKVRQGGVVYVAAEGARGILQRIKAWEAHNQTPVSDEFLLLPQAVYGVQKTRDGVGQHPMWRELREAATELRPHLIVLDTQARMTIGLEENSNSDMSAWVEAIAALKRDTGACILVVHHVGRNGKDARGASAIDGAQDMEWKVTRTGAKEALSAGLRMEKNKDGRDDIEWTLTMKAYPVGEDDEGRTITSLAGDVAPVKAAPIVLEHEARPTELQAEVLEVLRGFADQEDGATNAEIRRKVNQIRKERAKKGGPIYMEMADHTLAKCLSTNDGLGGLREKGLIVKLRRGVWAAADATDRTAT